MISIFLLIYFIGQSRSSQHRQCYWLPGTCNFFKNQCDHFNIKYFMIKIILSYFITESLSLLEAVGIAIGCIAVLIIIITLSIISIIFCCFYKLITSCIFSTLTVISGGVVHRKGMSYDNCFILLFIVLLLRRKNIMVRYLSSCQNSLHYTLSLL